MFDVFLPARSTAADEHVRKGVWVSGRPSTFEPNQMTALSAIEQGQELASKSKKDGCCANGSMDHDLFRWALQLGCRGRYT